MQIQGRSSASEVILIVLCSLVLCCAASRAINGTPSAMQESHEGHATNTVMLEGTRWKLTNLKGQEAPVEQGPRTPYLQLDAKTQRVSGLSGCNRLTGSYKLDGGHLAFGPIAGTMMACMNGMDIEQRFKAVLSEVNRWRIDGQILDLQDANGKPLAQFKAAPEDEPQKQ
jgi:heat shock protein HslJ